MVKNIEDMQQFGKDNMDATMKSFGSLSKSMQAIAVEMADYSKKVVREGHARRPRSSSARSRSKRRSRCRAITSRAPTRASSPQATKLGELYADLAKEVYKPFESQFGKVAAAK